MGSYKTNKQVLKKLTVEEAQAFIPVTMENSDELENAYFYTMVPMGNGWDEIQYYTNRNVQTWRQGKHNSWIYILSNKTMPGLYKIGHTTKHPDERAKEISRATGVPIPFEVEWAFDCFDSDRLEVEIHRALDSFRYSSNKEFFEISLNEAKETIRKLGSAYRS
jgi:hypothetical protein